MARNFRGRMEVVDAVNLLFRQIMNESVAEIAYDARAELVCGASFPEQEIQDGTNPYIPELLLIDRLGKGRRSSPKTRLPRKTGLILRLRRLKWKPPSWRPAPLPAESVR